MKTIRRHLEEILDQYDIGQLLSFEEIKRGLINKIVDLKTTNGSFILKIVAKSDSGSVNYEIDLLNHLKALPAPKPIKTRTKDYLIDYNGSKAFIYTYLPGEHREDTPPIILEAIGEFLGKLHLQTENFVSQTPKLETLSASKETIQKIIKRSKDIQDEKSKIALKYIEENIFKYPLPENLPKGAIHVDIKTENVLFTRNKLSGVVDFDNAYNGPLLLDLAIAAKWYSTRNAVFDIQKSKNIIQAYHRHRRLTEIELNSFDGVLHFAYLRNALRSIDLFLQNKLPSNFVYWALNEFIEAEKNLEEIDNIINL